MENLVFFENITEEYELLCKIKSSGHSELFLLYDKICERKVLMKTGKAELIENESRYTARLAGKGIPEVYGCIERGDKAYLLRQYIEGRTLHEIIETEGVFTPEKTAEIGIAVCEIISRLHSADPPVIHRDIKSDNLVMTPKGEIFIIDLGISREYDPSACRDTCVMGTPSAAPPEQFGYGQTDERSDIYALGVLLNELAAGKSELNLSKLPRKLSAVIKRCTEFAPEKRYRSAYECEKALMKIRKKPVFIAVPFILAACIAAVSAVSLNVNTNKNNGITEDTETVSGNISSAVQTEFDDTDDSHYIEIGSSYAGDWGYVEGIPKKVLADFDGDVKIELEIETVQEGKDGNYYVFVPVKADNRWEPIKFCSKGERSGNGGLIAGKGQKKYEFTLSKDVIDALGSDGIDFQVYNIIIKSAFAEKAVDHERKTEKIDTSIPYVIELNSEYQGDYSLCGNIPMSVLENYGGDVKAVLEIEIAGLYNYANFLPIALVGDDCIWEPLIDEIDCEYKRNEDGYIEMEYGQTECTLIISHEAIEKAGRYGIGFKGVNITVKSAVLCSAD